jgi:hypothetical protein
MEPGVSCYAATFDGKGWVIDVDGLDAASTMMMLALGVDRGWHKQWVLTGEVVGTGSDGEPCIKVATQQRMGRGRRPLVKGAK